MDVIEKWYSVKEFAGSFGISVDTVRRWIRRGLLKAFQFPRSSNKRKRTFETFLISETERQRFIRERMTS